MAHQKGIWRVLQVNVALHVLSHNLYSFTSQAQERTAARRRVRREVCAIFAVLWNFFAAGISAILAVPASAH
jgi:hypothetical protein